MVGFVLRNTLSEFGSVARGVCHFTGGQLDALREIVGIEKQGSAARYKNETGEFHALKGDEMVSMNMWGFSPGIFDQLRQQFGNFLGLHGADEKAEFYIPSVINNLIGGRVIKVDVLPTTSTWFGVTYREDRPFVVAGINELIRNGEYPEKLWP
jgi:hypothetical protein